MANTFGGKSKVIEKPIAVLNFEGGRLSQIKDSKGYALDTSTLPPLHQEMIRRLRTIKLDIDVECNFFENMETGDMMQLSGEQLEAGIPLTLEKRSGAVWFYHKVAF